MLKKRINLVDKFTTFLDISSNNASSIPWLRDRDRDRDLDLTRNFQEHYNLMQKDNEEFWIEYWLEKSRQSNPNPFAHKHIASYLEETAYWVAKKQALNYSSFNYSWQDLMQVARINLLNQEKFSKLFDKYNSKRGSITKLAKYKLVTVIYDFIHVGLEKRKYSDAALLRVVTHTFFRETLINAGIKDTEQNKQLSQCLLAWYCFKEIYTPIQLTGTQRLEWANEAQLESITNRYNQLLSKPQQGINSGKSNKWLQSCVAALHNTAINSETLNKSLLTCVKALRHDISLTIDSLDKPVGKPSDETQITLADTLEADKFDNYEEEELQNQEWNEIKIIFINSYNQLSQENQKMLQLELGLSLAQKYIGVAFSIEQYQVSRRLNRAKRLILTDVVQWSLQKFNITPEEVEYISQAIDACLVQYFKSNFGEFLTVNLTQSDSKNLEIFKLHYGKKLPLNKVAEQLNIPESALQERIDGVKQQLHLTLSAEVQRDLPLNSPESFSNEANQRIFAFIDAWIKNAPYATFGN
ncbi:hypothetical protein [Nostoc sphaeroides]|uniref:Sigma-70 family RNA polymerase sigma factor n=1 Tax=Nostoc sphaeroides CCNUC1 TaxID=2653204 RepID=A0A5P8WG00_9NOSO|nr:hypothetical protein [Nostoc sphaeroides]QFS51530.1 sigma-70 family RNA polymerase sigma factor [Nostoc sphaeroides CCNUC1]